MKFLESIFKILKTFMKVNGNYYMKKKIIRVIFIIEILNCKKLFLQLMAKRMHL